MNSLSKVLMIVSLLVTGNVAAFGQSTGAVAGMVVDQNSASVAGATVSIKGTGGQQYTAVTNDDGLYKVPSVPSGSYLVSITATGFKTTAINDLRVVAGAPTSANARLEIGSVTEIVEVSAGDKLIDAHTANVSSTISERQVSELPNESRDAVALLLTLPGVATVGRPRQSTINGLPKSAISITIDGVDVQDNANRTWDGFYAYISPRTDAVEEVTVSTAVPGADSSGESAFQVRFVTKRGSNTYKGGLFWQHRNTALNANYWYNNRDLPPDPATGKAPRNRILLNQFGGRLGGPLPFPRFGEGGRTFDPGKDRAFFFVNYEEFHLPASITRTRTILTPAAQAGTFSYITGGQTQMVNLFQIAAANGQLATPDPTVSGLLARIRSSVSSTGATSPVTNAPNRHSYSFMNSSLDIRRFLTLRFDANLTPDHAVEAVINRQRFEPASNFTRGFEPIFTGFPSYKYSASPSTESIALRSTLRPGVTNELRYTRAGGEQFFGVMSPDDFSATQGYHLNFPFQLGITDPFPGQAGYQRWEDPVRDITNSLTWLRGRHTLNFGGQYKRLRSRESTVNWVVPLVGLGVDPSESAFSVFNATTMPGSTPAQQNEARSLYGLLVGRVTFYDTGIWLDEDGIFRENGPLTRSLSVDTYGIYAQDQWRVRPGLTVNFGLRWQPLEGYVLETGNAGRLEDPAQIWGVSGVGNIFKPGSLTGSAPRVVLYNRGDKVYPDDRNNFAPTAGIAWSPDLPGPIGRLIGRRGHGVLRAGISRAFIREGAVQQLTPIRNTPGAALDVTRSPGFGNFIVGTNLRDAGNPNMMAAPYSPTPSFPQALNGGAAVTVDPNIKTGYVDSYSVGYQRQLGRDSAIEVRYVGNRGHGIRRTKGLNEANTIENGFAAEFALAQANLYANMAAGRGASFAYFGPGTGTSPLPIMLAYFNAPATYFPADPTRYVAANFTNGTLVSLLSRNAPNVLGFLASNAFEFNQAARRANAVANGLPVNFFRVNPNVNMANILSDDAHTWYDSMVVEYRRRLSSGIRVEANYVWSKAQSDQFASNENQRSDYTLRPQGLALAKNVQVFDIRHAFKLDATIDLPVGRGRAFWGGARGVVNSLVGGWTVVPVIRWQSGSPFSLGNVQLVGMTKEELQSEIRVRKGPTVVTYLPDDIILNTKRANDISVTSPTGYGTTFGGAPQGRFIAPAGYGNCIQRFVGECGFTNLILYGPQFFKLDVTVAKRFAIGERRNVELRATFLDALNHPNFRVGDSSVDLFTGFAGGPTFGQLGSGSAYRDLSGTYYPGGRVIDLLLRINF